MALESLAKLVVFYEECKEKGIVIHSDEFMTDTKKTIDNEIEIIMQEGKFMLDNPGPHIFGISGLALYFFPPELTQDGKWALIVEKDENRENFMFSTTYGLIEILIKVFKNLEKSEQ